MKKSVIWSVLALGFLVFAQVSIAEEAKVVLASYQPFDECERAYSPELKSGCYKVPPASEHFAGTKDHPAVVSWKLSKEAVNGKVFGPLPTSLRVADVKPVYKKQARRLIAPSQCRTCRFVSAQSAQGKQIARMMQRQMGIQMAGIIGFFVPFPFSLVVNTVTCAAVSTGFDAKEYREDYREEPSQQQYSDAFKSNALYCSPIGGMISAAESKNPFRFVLAGLGFSSYFVNVPTGVMYGSSALQFASGYTSQSAAVATKSAKQPKVRTVTTAHPKGKNVAAVQ